MKPLGDAFIRLITMIIALVIFCTVVSGIAGMEDMKKVGAWAAKRCSILKWYPRWRCIIGLVLGTWCSPAADSISIPPRSIRSRGRIRRPSQSAERHRFSDAHHSEHGDRRVRERRHPAGAAARNPVRIRAVHGGQRSKLIVDLFGALTHAVFGVINILMRLAPIGAFGAMAFTIGRYGLASLGPLVRLIATFYVTCILFVLIVLGAVAFLAGFNIVKFFVYQGRDSAGSGGQFVGARAAHADGKDGESWAAPGRWWAGGSHRLYVQHRWHQHLHDAGCSVCGASHQHAPHVAQQLTILAVAVLTSKGASGVQGAAFIALVGTMMVIPTIPVAGMALILGIDRFMSMFRALINMVGNGVATVVVARWENELDALVAPAETA
jgi:aerobic C4-dicarboxylate transport protein